MNNSMDIEKLKRDAQDQVDRALAEVDRLKGVAKELEESNKKAESDAKYRIEALEETVRGLENDKSVALYSLQKVKTTIESEQATKTQLSHETDARREGLVTLDSLIADKKEQLTTLENSYNKTIDKFNREIEEKETELNTLVSKIQEARIVATEEENRLNTKLTKFKDEITKADESLKHFLSEQDRILKVTKGLQSEASSAEHRKEQAEKELSRAEAKLATVIVEIESQDTVLFELKEEITKTEAELTPLKKQRIESIDFMKELANKEANLKAKYAEVGLEY